jgi:hypothetical protein
MTTTLTRPPHAAEVTRPLPTSRAYTVLMTLGSLAVLLQGLWAGLFLEHDNPDRAGSWIDVHARGGEVALILVAAATLTAFIRLRARRDLWIGGSVLTALLLVEAYVGGLIRDSGQDSLTPLHIPLGMALMGLTVWLMVRSRRRI